MPEQIPKGFLRAKNYIDVTQEYWETQEVEIPNNLMADVPTLFGHNTNTAYACVLNNLDWKVVWWGKIWDGKVHFKNMSKGVVYLPMQYSNKKLFPVDIR